MAENQKSRSKINLPQETETLLRSYFDAFANLYGITPLYRAFRIIQKQNPELALTEEDFLALADAVSQEKHLYIIAGMEDIYDDATGPTPPMKREIIAEYLYAVDDFESYEELKEEQEDKPFYIPEKEALLKYQDDLYFEKTREYLALGVFLRDRLKLKRVDDVLDDLQLGARSEDSDPQSIIWEVERLAGRGCLGSMEQVNEFFRYYFDMYNSTRLPANRGFTPNEMQEKLGGGSPGSIEFGPNISHALQTGEMDIRSLRKDIFNADFPVPIKAGMLSDLNRVEQKKPGRNDPCPCGSGKKWKKCTCKEYHSEEDM